MMEMSQYNSGLPLFLSTHPSKTLIVALYKKNGRKHFRFNGASAGLAAQRYDIIGLATIEAT
jgi:hypothetical protein